MFTRASPVFNRLLDRIGKMPVVDCHEHAAGPDWDLATATTEPIEFLISEYFVSDLWAARATDREIELLQSRDATTDEKWPVFSRLWSAAEHTAYARVTKLVLAGITGTEDLTREALDSVAEHLARRDESGYMKTVGEAGIRAVITDALYPPRSQRSVRYFGSPQLQAFVAGKLQMPEHWHPVFSLPYYHELRRSEFLHYVEALSDSNITCLGEYEEALFTIIEKCIGLGVIGFKDQSAYRRVIAYDLPPRSAAEQIFNRLLTDPRNQLAWPEAKPLDDYLFHQFMRFAREFGLPVQIHTGHMAHIRNRVDKTNAAHFASVLELHSRVQFDLFHGNWPYMGDLLFLGKNYPNVTLDLCWVNMIDPLYARELLKRAVMTVPHAKIHGFGGDYHGLPEFMAAHLAMAREVIASALADLVECDWLEEDEAVRMAADWLFNNPNAFYRVGLQPYEVGG